MPPFSARFASPSSPASAAPIACYALFRPFSCKSFFLQRRDDRAVGSAPQPDDYAHPSAGAGTITISFFKAHISEQLRKVRKGARIIISDRDTPIAEVVPYRFRAGAYSCHSGATACTVLHPKVIDQDRS